MKTEKYDYYYSSQQKRVRNEQNLPPLSVRIDHKLTEYTEMIKAGNKKISKWNDIIYLGTK